MEYDRMIYVQERQPAVASLLQTVVDKQVTENKMIIF